MGEMFASPGVVNVSPRMYSGPVFVRKVPVSVPKYLATEVS